MSTILCGSPVRAKYYDASLKPKVGVSFSFLENIGNGAFSEILKVKSIIEPFQEFAVKCPKPDFPQGIGHIEREERILKALNRDEKREGEKTYIVQLLASFTLRDNSLALLLPLYKRDLCQMVGLTEKGLSVSETMKITKQLLEVASFFKRCELIHRDLKPQNIFVQEDEQVKVGDFGLATYKEDPVERKALIGTRLYMSAEIAKWDLTGESPYDYASDLWAIACSIYELVNGESLFRVLRVDRKVDFESLRQAHIDSSANTTDFVKNRMEQARINKDPESVEILEELLAQMLQYDPKKRMTAEEGLALIECRESIQEEDLPPKKKAKVEDHI